MRRAYRLPWYALRWFDALLPADRGRTSTRAARGRVFYVGRIEPTGAAVYAVDDDEVRRLAPASSSPGATVPWGSPGDGALALSRIMLADFSGAMPDAACARAFSAAVLERLCGDGFVLEGQCVARWLHAAPRRQLG